MLGLPELHTVTNQDQAREIAIDWQKDAFGADGVSYGELAEAEAYFYELAEKYDLVAEFSENGIISKER